MQAWEKFLQQQVIELGQATVDRWLKTLKIVRYDACNIYLEALDSFQLLWFEEHIRPKLKRLQNNNGSLIRVHITSQKESGTKERKVIKKPKSNFDSPLEIAFTDIAPQCTFEEFIASQDNIVAYKLLEEVCNRLALLRITSEPSLSLLPQAEGLPKENINPIYLYGPSGSGKTHLLMATAQRLQKLGYQAIYCKAELFCEHVVKAMRSAEMGQFRDVYRKVDVLIIDDVHILAKKAATQEEFFHTFNTLHTHGKQIILSANSSPQNLQFIEPRLISRFEWGISLGLTPLNKKEMHQLIEKRASFFHTSIAPPTIDFLVESFSGNVKSLIRAEEALISRVQQSSRHDTEVKSISTTTAKILLKDLVEKAQKYALTPEKIVEACSIFYGIPTEDVTGKSQSRECVIPRQVSMYLCRKHLKMPFMKIGDLFSRDHSTVMSSIKQVEKQIADLSSDQARAVAAIDLKLSTRKD